MVLRAEPKVLVLHSHNNTCRGSRRPPLCPDRSLHLRSPDGDFLRVSGGAQSLVGARSVRTSADYESVRRVLRIRPLGVDHSRIIDTCLVRVNLLLSSYVSQNRCSDRKSHQPSRVRRGLHEPR
jgi:hypothetical protein